jgi:hypothetical protein
VPCRKFRRVGQVIVTEKDCGTVPCRKFRRVGQVIVTEKDCGTVRLACYGEKWDETIRNTV